MYVISYLSRNTADKLVSLESVSTPSLHRARTIANALKLAGYSVRTWRDNKLVS